MTRARLLFALAAAALLACSAETEPSPAPATSEISREDPEVTAALEALEKSSKADREQKLPYGVLGTLLVELSDNSLAVQRHGVGHLVLVPVDPARASTRPKRCGHTKMPRPPG